MIDSTAAMRAAAQLVDEKYAIDDDRRKVGRPPVWPGAFIEYAFPFAHGGSGKPTPAVERIPAELVVGASWSAVWDVAPAGSVANKLCDRLDQLALDRAEPNWAILVRVGPLPVWYAREGKNRVALYRALRRPLVAEARVTHHPDAQGLVVRRGEGIAGVTRAQLPGVGSPLPVPEAADLLLASGAKAGPPLSNQEVRRLEERAQKRARLLETCW